MDSFVNSPLASESPQDWKFPSPKTSSVSASKNYSVKDIKRDINRDMRYLKAMLIMQQHALHRAKAKQSLYRWNYLTQRKQTITNLISQMPMLNMSETMGTFESFNNTPTDMSQILLRSMALPNSENQGSGKTNLGVRQDMQKKLNEIKTSIFNIQPEDLWTILDDTDILKTKIAELKQYESQLLKEEKQQVAAREIVAQELAGIRTAEHIMVQQNEKFMQISSVEQQLDTERSRLSARQAELDKQEKFIEKTLNKIKLREKKVKIQEQKVNADSWSSLSSPRDSRKLTDVRSVLRNNDPNLAEISMNAGFDLIKREKDFEYESQRKEKALDNRRIELENLKESLDKREEIEVFVKQISNDADQTIQQKVDRSVAEYKSEYVLEKHRLEMERNILELNNLELEARTKQIKLQSSELEQIKSDLLSSTESVSKTKTKGAEIIKFLKNLKKLPEKLTINSLISVDLPVLVDANQRAEISQDIGLTRSKILRYNVVFNWLKILQYKPKLQRKVTFIRWKISTILRRQLNQVNELKQQHTELDLNLKNTWLDSIWSKQQRILQQARRYPTHSLPPNKRKAEFELFDRERMRYFKRTASRLLTSIIRRHSIGKMDIFIRRFAQWRLFSKSYQSNQIQRVFASIPSTSFLQQILGKTFDMKFSGSMGYLEYFKEISRSLAAMKLMSFLIRLDEKSMQSQRNGFHKWQLWSISLENFYYKTELSSIDVMIKDVKFRENTVKTELGILQKKYDSKLNELSILMEKYVLN